MSSRFDVPCLHRIHVGEPSGAMRIQCALGMSIERSTLAARLDRLEHEAAAEGHADRSVLVTFDDGWRDPLLLTREFKTWPHLQPVLFLTMGQLRGDRGLLPLARLYEWCHSTGASLDELEASGISRQQLKLLPEQEQHAWLDSLGVPPAQPSNEMLSNKDIAKLVEEGWFVGSHGHDHHDLRADNPEDLLHGLREALETTRAVGGVPWFAWPEGRCTGVTCAIAQRAGFEKQFSLQIEAGSLTRADLVKREIWS